MSGREAEPRTAVMIMVEASWSDQSGTQHRCTATMENTSRSGARIRLRKPIQVGSKLQVQWRWEQFTGAARYCRSEGKDYLVGIQKDPDQPVATTPASLKAAQPAERGKQADPVVSILARSMIEPRQDTLIRSTQTATKTQAVAATNATTVRQEVATNVALPTTPPVANTRERIQAGTERRDQAQGIGKAIEEKKPMRRKWFGLGHKEDNQDNGPEITREISSEEVHVHATPEREPRLEGIAADNEAGIELLPMADIYQTAGIRGPRKGYSINKISEMLRSEYLRGLSKEMKRASILVALDAAGISPDDVMEDAKSRMEAIDSYEASQRQQFEAHLVRRTEENQQIMAELERVKATYADRLRRNLEGVAREKATFGNWLTLKQQEAANISEALELFTQPVAAEPVKAEMDPSLISSKPV